MKRERSDAEVVDLLERVRAGELERANLVIAAHCRSEAARLALGNAAAPVPEGLEEWIAGLFAAVTAPARACSAALQCVADATWALGRPCLDEPEAEEDHPHFLATHAALDDWILCPCGEHSRRALAVGATGRSATRPAVAYWAVRSLAEKDSEQAIRWAVACVGNSGVAARLGDQIVEAVGAELVPWALGRRDPVRERVEARRQGRGDAISERPEVG